MAVRKVRKLAEAIATVLPVCVFKHNTNVPASHVPHVSIYRV